MSDTVPVWPRPTWKPLYLRCACGHLWQDWQPSGARADVFIAVLRTIRCPKCGGDRLFLRETPTKDIEP